MGNCSFAHSPEERDMWTFMKENKSEWGKCGQGTLGQLRHTPDSRGGADKAPGTMSLGGVMG